MKALRTLILGLTLLITGISYGQVTVTLNVGSPPLWGPAGYADVQYYYLPDVQAYYDVHSSMFIYQSAGVWICRTYLPTRYRNYDLYNGYKVVITDYRGHTPYRYYKSHRTKYARGYRGPEQHNIGERPVNRNPGGDMRQDHHSKKQAGHAPAKNKPHEQNKQKGHRK